jgi:hypothetical protein
VVVVDVAAAGAGENIEAPPPHAKLITTATVSFWRAFHFPQRWLGGFSSRPNSETIAREDINIIYGYRMNRSRLNNVSA